MAGWVQKLLGGRSQARSPRDLLADAMADFANADLASQALRFYDTPQAFEIFLDENNLQEAPWSDGGRAPTSPELAFEIFFRLLIANARIGQIDWASDAAEVIQVFDRLFAAAGTAQLADAERAELEQIGSHGKRGEAFLKLAPHLEAAAQTRGRKVAYFGMGQDAHFPALLTPQAYARWRRAKFGKGFPVLP